MGQLSLTFDAGADRTFEDTPAYVVASVGNGDENEVIAFDLSGTAGSWVDIYTETLDSWGALPVSVPIPSVPAGTYTLTVRGTTSTSDTLTFVVSNDPLDDAEDEDESNEPVYPVWTENLHRWRLIDTSLSNNVGGWEFVKNPSRWTNPNQPSFLEHDVTTAPDGNILSWEGAQRSWTFEFSGYIDSQVEYEALEFWSNLRRRFWLIDHRDVARYVTFEHFDARARIVPGKPWAHDYTVKAVHFYRKPKTELP
jgi:hypothetical protein